MKKRLVVLLALIICLSLCACGGEQKNAAQTDTADNGPNENVITETQEQQSEETKKAEEEKLSLLGEWVWAGDATETIFFNEDGTCSRSGGDTVKYEFRTDIGVVTLYDDTTLNYDVVEENGIVKLSGKKVYVRAENYEEAYAELLETSTSNLRAEFTDGKEEFELGKTYALSDSVALTVSSMEFTEHCVPRTEDEWYGLWLTAEVTNLLNTDVHWANIEAIMDGDVAVLIDAVNQHRTFCCYMIEAVLDENGEQVKNYPAQSTLKVKVPICETTNKDYLQKSIDTFGHIEGYIVMNINGVDYYIDLSDVSNSQ